MAAPRRAPHWSRKPNSGAEQGLQGEETQTWCPEAAVLWALWVLWGLLHPESCALLSLTLSEQSHWNTEGKAEGKKQSLWATLRHHGSQTPPSLSVGGPSAS